MERLGFRIWASQGCINRSSGFRVQGLGFRVKEWKKTCKLPVFWVGFRGSGLASRVSG